MCCRHLQSIYRTYFTTINLTTLLHPDIVMPLRSTLAPRVPASDAYNSSVWRNLPLYAHRHRPSWSSSINIYLCRRTSSPLFTDLWSLATPSPDIYGLLKCSDNAMLLMHSNATISFNMYCGRLFVWADRLGWRCLGFRKRQRQERQYIIHVRVKQVRDE